MAVRVTYNRAESDRLFKSPTGPVGRYVEDLTRQVANAARRRAPVDKGALRASIGTSIKTGGGKMVGTVKATVKYAIYVHEGTGLYGPKHKIIKPKKKGGVLVFKSRGGMVFSRYSRGQRPQPFLVDALFAVVPGAFVL